MKNGIHTRVKLKLDRMPELLYTVCIGYFMITMILHSTTQLPYTGLVLLFFLTVIDILFCHYIHISKFNLCILLFYAIWFVGSFIFVKSDATAEYAVEFICFAPIAAYISEYNLDQERVKGIICNLAVVFVIFYVSGLMEQNLQSDYFNTGLGILPGIISLFIFTYKKMRQKKYLFGTVLMVLLVSSSFSFLSACSRGAFASYVCFVIVYLLVEDTSKWTKTCIFVIFIACIYVAFHMENFVRWGYRIMQKMNVDIRFFSKSIEKIRTSTISSHRNTLYSTFFQSDIHTFIFGRGIGGFEKQVGKYTHNIILSKWSDFGIVGLIWILFVMAVTALTLIKVKNDREILMVILGSSFFPLMFSYTYWSFPCFFLLEFLVMKYFAIGLERKHHYRKKRWESIRFG